MLNETYDGFMDMAKVLHIPPKAIGLNGTLAMAWGARGSGWASAHYEPSLEVINLTKTRGAGSLAHEWWHALDKYMSGKSHLATSTIQHGTRHDELHQPLLDLIKGIESMELYQRSIRADGSRGKPYFGTTVEITARAYEGFIVHQLKEQGLKNDFLANIRPIESWGKAKDKYPYPIGDELPKVSGLYQNVFNALQVDKSFERSEEMAEEAEKSKQKSFNDLSKLDREILQNPKVLREFIDEVINEKGQEYLYQNKRDELKEAVMKRFEIHSISTTVNVELNLGIAIAATRQIEDKWGVQTGDSVGKLKLGSRIFSNAVFKGVSTHTTNVYISDGSLSPLVQVDLEEFSKAMIDKGYSPIEGTFQATQEPINPTLNEPTLDNQGQEQTQAPAEPTPTAEIESQGQEVVEPEEPDYSHITSNVVQERIEALNGFYDEFGRSPSKDLTNEREMGLFVQYEELKTLLDSEHEKKNVVIKVITDGQDKHNILGSNELAQAKLRLGEPPVLNFDTESDNFYELGYSLSHNPSADYNAKLVEIERSLNPKDQRSDLEILQSISKDIETERVNLGHIRFAQKYLSDGSSYPKQATSFEDRANYVHGLVMGNINAQIEAYERQQVPEITNTEVIEKGSQFNPANKKDAELQKIADKILAQVEKNEAPWQRSYQAGDPKLSTSMPVNTDGKPYRGINALNLWAESLDKGYNDNRWYTYKGAIAAGGQVRKGEQGTRIQFWQFTKEEDGETVQLERPIFRTYSVFNAEQIDGLPPREQQKFELLSEFERHDRAEHILSKSGVNIEHSPLEKGYFSAYYMPSNDTIVLPPKELFKSESDYYATALHELAHATGHESRLNRDLSGEFGSYGYAKEELRAEISSLLIGQDLQLGHDPTRHYTYLQSWAKIIKNDPKEFFQAVKDADAIAEYVLDLGKDYEKKQELESELEANNEPTLPTLDTQEQEQTQAHAEPTPIEGKEMNKNTEKTYLYVPYAEKDEAKKLGARWDKEAESWYVPADKNVSDFSRWTSPPVVESPETQFTKVLQAAGCVVPSGHPIMDGRFHRIPVEGDKSGAKSGSYIVHLDGVPRGTVQNFRTGSQTKWVANVAQDYKTPNTAEITAARLKAEQEQKARYDKVANDVKQLLSVAPVAQSHPYLKKKEVQAHGLYIVPNASQLPQDSSFKIANDWREAKAMRNHFAETGQEYTVLTRGDLIVPAYQNGEIRTMQTINEGFKGFVKGGEKSGSYLVLGEPKQNEPILIAEGYATAATLHEALGRPVVVAFDAGNLSKVANTVRENLPNSQIYIMADNDIKNEKNTGIVKAEEAAKQVDGLVIAPQFESPEHGSDWNDLATNKGVDELKSQIRSQLIAYQLQKEGTLNITKKNFQDPEMNAVQEQVMGKALASPQSLINRYAADPRTFEGRYIASDMMKEVFEVYSESPQARNQYNNAVHNTAAALAAEHFNQVLESPKDGERNKVVFLTGSPGAGKTSSILNNGNFPDDAKLVFEGQLANAHQNPATLDKLQKALDLGYEVEIRVAHPKPEIALENTFRRYYDVNDGRGAPIDTMARIQGNTPEALKFIHDKFGDKVSLVINDTTQGYENIQQLRGWEHLNVLQSQGNEQQIKQRLEASLIQHYAEGRIDYECFKQSAGSDERAKQLEQELSNNRRLVQSINDKFRANEQGRELPPAGGRESNQLDERNTARASRRTGQEGRTESQLQPSAQRVYQDTRESLIEQAKNTLSNKDYINVESWVRNVDYKYSNAINEGLQKLQSLQSKLPDIASGKFNLPPAPPIVQQQTIQIQPSQGQDLENDTDKKLN